MSRDPMPADAVYAMRRLFAHQQRAEDAHDDARARIDPATYVVDSEAVAAAIVERLLAGRSRARPRHRRS